MFPAIAGKLAPPVESYTSQKGTMVNDVHIFRLELVPCLVKLGLFPPIFSIFCPKENVKVNGHGSAGDHKLCM